MKILDDNDLVLFDDDWNQRVVDPTALPWV